MKRINYLKYISAIFLLFILIGGQGVAYSQSLTGAGTVISNFAQAYYKNTQGDLYSTVSPTVTLNVRAISALYVTPDETEPSTIIAANDTIVRQFRVCNTSNVADAYTLTKATVTSPAQIVALYYDVDNNGIISAGDIPVTINGTKSPSVEIGACISVLAQVETRTISLGQPLNISITARSNISDAANGFAENDGTIINTTGKSATFTNPDDPTLIPSKLVENQSTYISAKGQKLNYVIAFRNNGDVQARNVVVVDDLPAELQYVANTLRINGNPVSDADDTDEGSVVGQHLTVKPANPVSAGQAVRVTFQAIIVNNKIPGAGIINTAKIGAANAPTIETSQAITVVDPFGTVYAARGGATSPVAGAKVAILTDQSTGNLLTIPDKQVLIRIKKI